MSDLTGLESIRAFIQLSNGTGAGIGTSGMPRAEHFKTIAEAGYRTVINLALPTSDNALPNEGELVSSEGMTYVHIPVLFDAPLRDDYERFENAMEAFGSAPVFVHCAANMRVSAFMFLYRLRSGKVSRAEALRDLRKIWEPDEVWRKFINANLPRGEEPLRAG